MSLFLIFIGIGLCVREWSQTKKRIVAAVRDYIGEDAAVACKPQVESHVHSSNPDPVKINLSTYQLQNHVPNNFYLNAILSLRMD